MKRIWLTLILFAVSWTTPASAQPFLMCDSYTTGVIPTYFKASLDGGADVVTPAWTGTTQDGTPFTNSSHYDVGAVSVGEHVATLKACVGDSLWGTEVCSAASVPFSFTRPSPPSAQPSAITGGVLKR